MKLPDNKKNFSQNEIELYKSQLIDAMKKQGATDEDFEMFSEEGLFDDIVITAMYNGRSPEDVAWAVLQ
jgi:hypothetical protein